MKDLSFARETLICRKSFPGFGVSCLAAAFVIFFFPILSYGASPVNNEELLSGLEKDKFTEVKSVKDLPESAKSYYCGKSGSDISKVMADPGQPWESGCVRTGNSPSKGFVVGAKSKNFCLLYFESGGIALMDVIEVLKLSDGKPAERAWSSSMFRDHPKNMDELLKTAKQRIKEPIR